MSKRVVERMKTLDYRSNLYGWGIDTAASMFCHAVDLLVTMDAGFSAFSTQREAVTVKTLRERLGLNFASKCLSMKSGAVVLLIYKITYPKRERSKETIAEKIKWLIKTAEAGGISAGLKFYKLTCDKYKTAEVRIANFVIVHLKVTSRGCARAISCRW